MSLVDDDCDTIKNLMEVNEREIVKIVYGFFSQINYVPSNVILMSKFP